MGRDYSKGRALCRPHAESNLNLVLRFGRGHELVPVHATPGGNVVQCPGVGAEHGELVTRGQALHSVLGPNHGQGTQQPFGIEDEWAE